MVSKSQSKLIRSLNQKKYRFKHGLFLVEGTKAIIEFLNSSFQLHQLYATSHLSEISESSQTLITEAELKSLSRLSTPQKAVAIFKISENVKFSETHATKRILALDGIRDPGNLGTIIRLCDWFGIETLLCSKDTVDCYNPKVVQATMGSLARVSVHYVDLANILKVSKLPVYGTFMDGGSIYSEKTSKDFIIVMGNEANGISKPVERYCTKRLSIPQFGSLKTTESLNVATAAAITLSEFLRSSSTET